MQRHALLVALVVTALAVGCGEKSAPRLAETQLGQLVLQPADLPRGFQAFDFGRQVRVDAHPGPRSDAARFGRQDGWKARYRNGSGSDDPTIVESRADIFASSKGAKADLAAYGEEIERSRTNGWKSVDVPAIGDASRGGTLLQGVPKSRIRYFIVAWREGRISASVTVSGFDRSTTLAEAVAFARKQQVRLAGIA